MNSPLISVNHASNHGAGAYGRDGAPASNFMSSPARAHRHPSPQRPNIAPSERPIPPMDRFSPMSSAGSSPPPSYANQFGSPYDSNLSPPKAAFLEAASVSDHSSDSPSYGLIHGKTSKAYMTGDFYTPSARLEDLKRPRSDEESSAWLKKQAQAGSKFKSANWFAAIVSLVVIIALIVKIVTTKSAPVTSPRPLKWANGASSVPTFGTNAQTNQSQSTQANSTSSSSNSQSTSTNQRRSLHLLD